MASPKKFVWSTFSRISTSDDGAFATSHTPITRCVEGAFTMGVCCNPETGVGLLVAMAEPTSSYLRIVNKPIRTDIHDIMTVADDLCCNGICSSVNRSCKLCSYRLLGRRFYMYISKMFCTRGCRFDFFMEALYDQRYMELTGKPTGNQISATMKELLVSAEEEDSFRKTFFTTREKTKFPK